MMSERQSKKQFTVGCQWRIFFALEMSGCRCCGYGSMAGLFITLLTPPAHQIQTDFTGKSPKSWACDIKNVPLKVFKTLIDQLHLASSKWHYNHVSNI